MVKKLYSIALVFAVIFVLTSCDFGKVTEFDLQQKNNVSKQYEFEVLDIEAGDKIEPSVPGKSFTCYESNDDNKMYLKVELNIKNLGDEEVNLYDKVAAQFLIGNCKYASSMVEEKEDGSDFIKSEDITLSANAEKKVLFLASIPNSALNNDITMEMELDDERFKTVFNLSDIDSQRKIYGEGDEIKEDDKVSFDIASIDYRDSLKPSDEPEFSFSYFNTKNKDNVFLVVAAKVKNLKDEDVVIYPMAGIKAVFENKVYDANKIIESDDGSALSTVDDTELKSQEEKTIYYVIEIPKKRQDDNYYLKLNFNDGKGYMLTKPN